jgi:hypothetical protein
MATRDTLIFSGRRRSGVQEAGHAYHGRFCQFTFTVPGDGRQWVTHAPMAFWRNFAELDLTSTKQALDFIARHGDPFGDLDRESRTGTNDRWPALKTALADIAQAWDPLDNDTSHISEDPHRRTLAQHALYELARPDKAGLGDIEVIAQGDALVLRAKTLQAFMIASASSALRRGIAMRICQYCGDWFELRRSDATFCSASCVAAGHKFHKLKAAFDKLKGPVPKAPTLKTMFDPLKGHSRGKRAQADPSRPDHISRHLARKRPRSKDPTTE